jgi:hypothetical protein
LDLPEIKEPDGVDEAHAIAGEAFAKALDEVDGTVLENVRGQASNISVVYASYSPTDATMSTAMGKSFHGFLINTAADQVRFLRASNSDKLSYSGRTAWDKYQEDGDERAAIATSNRLGALHEFAHLADVASDSALSKSFLAVIQKMFDLRQHSENGDKAMKFVNDEISHYATTSIREAMAEATAKYVNEGKLPGELQTWAETMIGKPKKKTA